MAICSKTELLKFFLALIGVFRVRKVGEMRGGLYVSGTNWKNCPRKPREIEHFFQFESYFFTCPP